MLSKGPLEAKVDMGNVIRRKRRRNRSEDQNENENNQIRRTISLYARKQTPQRFFAAYGFPTTVGSLLTGKKKESK